MKAKIHPTYYPEAKVTCSCGNTFTTGSTKPLISVEVCHKCHPFYTGEHRFIDTKGRIDVFTKKQQVAQEYKKKVEGKREKREKKEEKKPKTLKELLAEF